MIASGNFFDHAQADRAHERVETLLATPGVRIERIISLGQRSPEGFWYDQHEDEWVILLRGRARLMFESGVEHQLNPGDFLHLPARQRHRVAWTDPDQPTLWLAVHWSPQAGS